MGFITERMLEESLPQEKCHVTAPSMPVKEKGEADPPVRISVRSLAERMDFDHLIEQFNKISTI